MDWTHDALMHDLAEHLRGTGDRVVWTDMQLGPAGSPRPDVYTIPKSYAKFRPLAYEIKISVADFRRDVTAGKWQSYLEFAAGVIFAVPSGLVDKKDIPSGCGLIVRSDAGWRTTKGPTLKVVDNLPKAAWLKLVIDGIARQPASARVRSINQWRANAAVGKRHGKKIAEALNDLSGAEARMEFKRTLLDEQTQKLEAAYQAAAMKHRERVRSMESETTATMRTLAAALGLPPTTEWYEIQSAARAAVRRLEADSEIKRLREAMNRAQRALAEAEKALPFSTGETA